MRCWIAVAVVLLESVAWGAAVFSDDFERADGDLTQWVMYAPAARIEGGRLALDSTAGREAWAWAGQEGRAIFFEAPLSIRFSVEFAGFPGDVVGRHGGVFFCAATPTHRYDAAISGYFVDWIDRQDPNYNDHGMRVHRVDNGVHTLLAKRTEELDPPTEWEIVFTENGFEVYGDGEQILFLDQSDSDPADPAINDTTYRSGFIGFWCFSNAGQLVYFDDFVVELESDTCPKIIPGFVRARFEDPPLEVQLQIPAGANAEASYTVTIESSDPEVVTVQGAAGGSLDVVFQKGDPLVKALNLVIGKVGSATLSLRAGGVTCEGASVEVVPKPSTMLLEDFSGEPDGAPVDFVVFNAEGTILNEALVIRPAGVGEPTTWIGVGGVPQVFQDIARISFTVSFSDAAVPPVGRHGGVAFCRNQPTTRAGPGYTFDFIDRDVAFRVLKDNNAGSPLAVATGEADPGEQWTIELTSTTMTFSVDGNVVAEVEDATYRSGYIGFWAYTNAGQELQIDDVEIVFAPARCSAALAPQFAVTLPGEPPPPVTLSIPVGWNLTDDYTVTLSSSDPDVIKPADSDETGTLEVVFPAGGALSQEVELEAPGSAGVAELRLQEPGGCDPVTAYILVPIVTDNFTDDFSQPDGPPQKWTVYSGTWNVSAGALSNEAYTGPAPSPWVWAGSPPLYFEGVTLIRFNYQPGEPPLGAVGRHGGVMFFAREPTQRWITSGYEIDWIDRATDRGYRFIRYDDGVETLLAGPTLEQFPEPGSVWEIEIADDTIVFSVDGELVFSVVDTTYRSGFVGFWAYENDSIITIDEVQIGTPVVEPGLFIRGDVNADGSHNIADAIAALGYLFGGQGIPCLDAADINDDGGLNIADPITLLQYLFAGGPPPPAPFEACGGDPTPPGLGCDSFPPCR